MVPVLLAGIAAKLTGLGVAAKAGIGLGIATVATAGVATVMPVVVPEAPVGATRAVEVQVPNVVGANADLGLTKAADATGAQAGAGATGLDRARQTPAADKLPAQAGRPDSVPAANGAGAPPVTLPAAAGAGATGIDAATETPGGQHIPPFVKGMFGRS